MKNKEQSYINSEGFSSTDILKILTTDGMTKKEITTKLSAKKSIDTLLTKLIESNSIIKEKNGTSILFKKPIKAKKQKPEIAIDYDALRVLENELISAPEKKSKKIVHKKEKINTEYEDVVLTSNPFGFVLDFFNDCTVSDEISTNYFRRRDDYLVKSLYNKLKSMCAKRDDYNVDQQNVPFYRSFSVNFNDKVVKILHIDMNRTVRGIHTVFELTDDAVELIKRGNNGC